MSEKPSFFSELRRRNVYKVAVAYAVVGWLVIQVSSTVLPTFHAPEWVVQTLVVLVAIGFPIALVIAWAFELTPQGLKRTEDVDPAVSARQPRKHAWIYVVILGAMLSIGLFFLGRFTVKSKTASPNESSAKSIAVLPFDNLSRDPDNAYFSEGIQDEILTRLAKVSDLKVVSRTSAQKLKSESSKLRDIAEQLGVTNILEGSVQKSANQVRVNVQLINAMNDVHLWANTYDRKLTDIFAVESEIARAVAEALQAKLSGSAERVLASRPTDDPEAHQLYLKGRYFWNRRTEENLNKAIGYFQQAIEKDPLYALAYAGLADSYALLPIYTNNPPKEDVQRALAAAHRALELDDTLAEAHTSLGNALVDDLQLPAAEPEFRRAIALNPSYATAHQWLGECLQGQGRFNEAVAELKQAHDFDPLSLIINAVLGSTLGTAGRNEEAIQQLQRTLEMDPAFGPAHFMLGEVYENMGRLKEATTAYEKARDINPTPIRQVMLARMYLVTGRRDDAMKIFDDLTNRAQRENIPLYPLALTYLAYGDNEKALQSLQKCYEERGIQLQGNSGSLKIDKRLDPLRNDPRFQELVAKFMGQTK